jgi:hypothetical protein
MLNESFEKIYKMLIPRTASETETETVIAEIGRKTCIPKDNIAEIERIIPCSPTHTSPGELR